MDKLRSLLDSADTLLTGEPARAIGYGAAIVVVGVVAISNALGYSRFGSGLDLTTAVGLTTTAVATVVGLVESIRHYVFSSNTVARMNLAASSQEAGTIDPATAADIAAGSLPG